MKVEKSHWMSGMKGRLGARANSVSVALCLCGFIALVFG